MSIALPGVTITTIDKSQLASLLADIMNIGLAVDSPTGPMEITKCSGQNEFLSLYSLSNEISADDHTTMLHAMKLLQFTPVYVSRAGSTTVLPARTDKSDTSGSTLVYVDQDYSPYYKLWKFGFNQGGISNSSAYLVFRMNTDGVKAIVTTSELLIDSNDKTTVTEDSGESNKYRYGLYLGDEPSINLYSGGYVRDMININEVLGYQFSDDGNYILSDRYNQSTHYYHTEYDLNDYDEYKFEDGNYVVVPNKTYKVGNYIKVSNSGSDEDKYVIITNKYNKSNTQYLPNLENLFNYFNKAVTNYNYAHSLGDDQLDEFYALALFDNVSLEPNTINVNAGLNLVIELDNVYPKPNSIDDNVITSNYYMLAFNESNDIDDEFVKLSLGRSSYYSINGVTYYNPAGSGNLNYPGTLVELNMYNGFEESPNSPLIRTTELTDNGYTMSRLDFVTYMIDALRGSGLTSPILDSSTASVEVGIVEGTGYINSDTNKFYPIYNIGAQLIGDPSINDYLTISLITDTKLRFISSKSMKLLTNTGIKFTMNYGNYDPDSDSYTGGTKYLFMNIGNISDPDSNDGNTYNINDVNTLTKLVYRIAEFFSYKNDWLSNQYGKSTLWNLDLELPLGTYRLYLPNPDGTEIELGNAVVTTDNRSLLVINVINDEYKNKLINPYSELPLRVKAIGPEISDDVVITIPGFKYNNEESFSSYVTAPFTEDSSVQCLSTRYDNSIVLVVLNPLYKSHLDKIINNAEYYYLKTSIDSVTTSLSSDVVELNMTGISGVSIHNYNISSTKVNNLEKLYENQYIKITKTLGSDKDTAVNYIFYNGNYRYAQLPSDVLIRISTAKLTYSLFVNQLVVSIKSKLDCTPLSNGFALYEHDDQVEYKITGNTEIFGDISESVILFNELINNAGLIVVSKYTNKDNILRYKIDINDDDPEIYTLTLIRKSSTETYLISFVPNKVNSYGENVYYTHVNDEDNGSRDFYIFRENEDVTNLPPDHYESPLFGGEVLVVDASPREFITAYERFREKLGVYYDILFDAGLTNISVLNEIFNVGKDIYSLAVLTEPDYSSPSQLKNYREQLGIDHWEAVLLAPRVPDTTLGNFLVYMSPGTQYIERLILNKLGGKEFAPAFYFTNGRTSLKPKYRYTKDSDRSQLINSQISPIVWDRARLLSYFLLDLTMLKLDSSLSDANNSRLINVLSHICDDTAEGYIGRFNDEGTRDEFLSELRTKIDSRMMNNQTYHMNDYRLICDTTNNTKEIIELRNLVLDVYVLFLPGIRYVKVFLTVYKLSLDLDAV